MKNTKTQFIPKHEQPVQGFYTQAEVAALMRCSVQTVMRARTSGKLKAIQPGGPNTAWLIPQGNLAAFLNGGAK